VVLQDSQTAAVWSKFCTNDDQQHRSDKLELAVSRWNGSWTVKKRILDLSSHQPLLDIVSYGRGGPRYFSRAELDQIERTVDRAPEVVVKVSGGARSVAGVRRSLRYYGRDGKLELESDTGERMAGKDFDSVLVEDWNLDIEAHQPPGRWSIRGVRKSPKLVHNAIFSMPPGTPAAKVLKAVRRFAWDEFGLKH
jgi:hypothetical protein